MNIPERLNPPKDDWTECPDCADGKVICDFCFGRGYLSEPTMFFQMTCPICNHKGKKFCPHCGGEGVISRAEERRELEAAIGDREYDAAQDRKMEEEAKP